LFRRRTETPIEERNYAPIYLIFSGLLFLGTVWAVVDEVSTRRPWKDYQREFYELAVKKLTDQRNQALAGLDSSKYRALEKELADAESSLTSDEYQNAAAALKNLRLELDVVTRDWRFARSRSDAEYYEYKKNVNAGREDPSGKERLEQLDAEIAKHASEMDSLNKKIAEVQAVMGRYSDRVDSLTSEKKQLLEEVTKLNGKIEHMKSAPLEVRQTVLNDFEMTNFQELKARVDRCVTCHVGYKDPLFSDAPQPFTTHPIPELLAIHNPDKFGCTPCHRGQGPALTAGDAHGNADPYWEFPLLRGKDVYAGCNSCHGNDVVVKFGERLTKAKQLLMESGCFGCHEIKHFTNLPKIGPELNDLTAKVKPEWVYHWVKNPKEYNPHTRMPNFRLADDEAEAVTAYLVDVSRQSSFRLAHPPGSYTGGVPSKGKQLVETIGCKGCHVVGNDLRMRNERGTSYDIAPELTWVAGKVNADWLYDWLKNPRHYHVNTRMPSLRLTDAEARDIVAYLLSLKDDRPVEPKRLDLNNKQKIERGLKVIKEYGCFGCHDIKGTENEGKVSVALSNFGRKQVQQMDFGDTKVPHTWDDWVRNKLKDSRTFQTDRIVQKMPVFAFSDDEIETLRMLLKSFQREGPTEKYEFANTKREQQLNEGRRLTMWYNCIQCHQLEDRGGYIAALLEDQALRPPLLTIEGAKVQEPWLHGFLKSPSVIRPWLNIRMPTFSLTDEEISTVTKYFLALSKQELELRDYAATPLEEKYLPAGKKLFEEYQCAKCHPAGAVRLSEEVVASTLAPNLGLAAGRLKPEWIESWLHDPQKIQPGTMMPTFFYEGQAPDATVFGGNADEQIRALKTYVWSLGKRGRASVSSR
jgi:mono/diheme cytochrome c family protein/uncharacterized coiled-coil protein SlyX